MDKNEVLKNQKLIKQHQKLLFGKWLHTIQSVRAETDAKFIGRRIEFVEDQYDKVTATKVEIIGMLDYLQKLCEIDADFVSFFQTFINIETGEGVCLIDYNFEIVPNSGKELRKTLIEVYPLMTVTRTIIPERLRSNIDRTNTFFGPTIWHKIT